MATAQSVLGTISGTVTDASRVSLAGAPVRLVHLETNRIRATSTDTLGQFTFSNLPPGQYRIEAEHEGYRRHVRQVALSMNQELQVEVPLLPGRRTDTVEVTAAPQILRTDSSSIGGLIENRQITGLPLDGRNFFELSLLLPGVTPAAPGSAGSVRGDFAVNVNGAREDSNSFLLDGVFNGDPQLNHIGVTPPLDAVREFEVASGAYDASFGRSAGGQVSVVLRSGTNRFSGTAYGFLRNRVVDARNFFAPATEKSPQYQRGQAGASLGGPVVRNRTFFFADYEGRRLREGMTRITNVPTGLERAGDFSRSNLLAIDLFTQRPFEGNVIPATRRHPVGLAIAGLYPNPNRPAAGQNFVSSPAARDREDHFDVRLDHNLGASDDLSLRYSFADRSLYEPFSGPTFSTVPGFGTNVGRRAQNAVASQTHVFSPSFLNELRLGFNRVSIGTFHENLGRNRNAGIGLPQVSTNPRNHGLSVISITGYSPLGDESHNPQQSARTGYQITNTATRVLGRHLLKAGGDVRWLQQNGYRDEMARGFISFLGMTGNALAEMLQGFPSVTGVARVDNHQHLRTRSAYFFVQDAWRARLNLTVWTGVRYEYNTPPVDAFDRANTLDPASGTLVPVGTGGVPRSGYRPDRNNWAPRIGLAWRPGQGRTVVRTGYGLYYDQSALAPGEGLYFNAPYFVFSLYFPMEQMPLTLSNPFPGNFPVAMPASALAFQRDLRSAYTQHWNFNVQRELGARRVLEAGYAGSKGTKLAGGRDLNQPFASTRRPNPRPVPQFADITALESRGNSSYHSLQVRFQQAFQSGLTALASYTWSKSIDDGSGFFSSAGDPNYPQDSLNAGLERGLSNFDLRHRLSVSYSYDLPFGQGRLLGGWQTFGLWTFQSGRPFTVALLSDLDNSNTGRAMLGFGANDRPNVLRNPELSTRTPERWFDTAAFVLPPFGSFGDSGRNILTGPGYQNISASIIKNLALAEGASLQFRAETFNLLNRANFDLPDIFFGSPSFGRIQSAQSPRRVQFGLKLLF